MSKVETIIMIKIYTLSLLFFLTSLFATAQFDIGQKVVGGNVGFTTTTTDNYYRMGTSVKQVFFSVSPSIAKFTKSNQLCGIGLYYNYLHQQTRGNYSTDPNDYSHYIGLNLFSQHFFTLAPKFYFSVIGTGSLGYSFGSNTYRSGVNEINKKSSGYNINIGLAPGLSYRIIPRLLFDAYLNNFLYAGYTHSQVKENVNVPAVVKGYANSFTVSSSLGNTSLGNIGVGFRWLLKK